MTVWLHEPSFCGAILLGRTPLAQRTRSSNNASGCAVSLRHRLSAALAYFEGDHESLAEPGKPEANLAGSFSFTPQPYEESLRSPQEGFGLTQEIPAEGLCSFGKPAESDDLELQLCQPFWSALIASSPRCPPPLASLALDGCFSSCRKHWRPSLQSQNQPFLLRSRTNSPQNATSPGATMTSGCYATTWTSKRAQNSGPISQNREYTQYRVHYFGHFGGPGTYLFRGEVYLALPEDRSWRPPSRSLR